MKSVLVDAAGAPFRLVECAAPQPGPGHVLVRVLQSGVNPLDTKIRAGRAAHARHPFPAVLGIDLSGVVEGSGGGVSGFRRGDRVFGMVGGVGGIPGTLSELVSVDARLLAPLPATLSSREAAALPLVAITAWEALVERARVQAGQRVLVHGGAGGVGHVGVRLARALGATVYSTGRAPHRGLIEELGAVFIDREQTSPEAYVAELTEGRGFDVVFDTVGGGVLDASFQSVRRSGHVVSALGWGTHALAPLSFKGATYSGVFTLLPLLTGEDRARQGGILRKIAELGIAPIVDPRRFTLETVEEAHCAAIDGSASVKIVVDVSS